MKHVKPLLLVLLLAIGFRPVVAEDRPKPKKEVLVGIYLEAIDNIKLNDGTCYFEFWMWANYNKTYFDSIGIKPLEELNILHCPDIKLDGEVALLDGKRGNVWALQKYRLLLNQDYEALRFPLDEQTLKIQFEIPIYDLDKMTIALDQKNTFIDSSVYSYLKHNGWRLEKESVSFARKEMSISSNMGNMFDGQQESRHEIVELSFLIDRHGSRVFLKIFLILYVSLLMAAMIFFMDKSALDARLTLIVGGIFGAIGNKYIIESEIPHSPVLTLSDLLHIITYLFLFLILLVAIVEYQERARIAAMGKKRVQKINGMLFAALLLAFAVSNLLCIWFYH